MYITQYLTLVYLKVIIIKVAIQLLHYLKAVFTNMCLAYCVFLLLSVKLTGALYIDGCPLFGCRPSGSFSFYLNIPTSNASVNWVSSFVFDPVPNPLGCAADSVNIVCLSNGPFSEDKGYVSLYGENGTVRWRDKVLQFPTLPLLDNYGDVTGSDGNNLVHYDLFGKLYPVIKCYGLRPMFSLQLVSTIFLLLVSEQGELVVRDTNAIPVASIFLNGTVQRANGTFLPISQPVVSGSRFYLLTEFVPESDVYDPEDLNLQRLYAIDVHHRLAEIVTVAWYFNFEMESRVSRPNFVSRDEMMTVLYQGISSKQNVIWDAQRGHVYVSLPPPYLSSNSQHSFWGFRDNGDSGELLFRSNLDVTHMATFEPNSYSGQKSSSNINNPPVWICTADSVIHSLTPDGNISRSIDLKALLKSDISITSKMSLVQQNDTSTTYLVFGITAMNQTTQFSETKRSFGIMASATSFVVAVETDTPEGSILWMVPVPDNMEVKGQLSGSSGADFQRKDQIIFYAEETGKRARIISIH